MSIDIEGSAMESIRNGVYKKNIHYIYDGSPREYEMVKALGGNCGVSSWLIQNMYRKIGSQVRVSKQVSDDMLSTDFSSASRIQDVPWVTECVEMYFEDPLLPTILLMKRNPDDIVKVIPFLEKPTFNAVTSAKEYITALMQEGSDVETGKHLSLQLRPEMYDDFILTAESRSMELGVFSHPLNDTDHAIMCYMLRLAMKVFVFASLPQFKPTIVTRNQMQNGGKPGVKDRPSRPSVRVHYLPSVKSATIGHAHTGEGREFRGRRGHIRWYSADRYVNMKGKWDIIQPVADPVTGKYPEKHIFKVRKPTQQTI